MEKAKIFLSFALKVFMMSLILLSFPSIYLVSGNEEQNEDRHQRKIMILPAGSVINKEYFAYGNIVEISGTVNGDVYAVGGQVTIDGKINGDLIALGGTVNVSGTISQNVRIAGGNINITGEVGKNVTAAAGHLSIAQQGRIYGGLVAAAGTVNLTGPIGGNADLAAGNVTLSNAIAGEVRAAAGQLRVTSRGAISGNLTYWSNQPPAIDEGAKISGKVISGRPMELGKASGREFRSAMIFLALVAKSISLISTLILGLILISLFPGLHEATITTLKQSPWSSLGVGFVFFFMVPITAVFLFLSIFGIPLAFILGSAYMIFLYVVRIPLILSGGLFLYERFGKTISNSWAFFIGLLIYFFLGFIPLIGNLVTMAILFFGAGAAILTFRNLYSKAEN